MTLDLREPQSQVDAERSLPRVHEGELGSGLKPVSLTVARGARYEQDPCVSYPSWLLRPVASVERTTFASAKPKPNLS